MAEPVDMMVMACQDPSCDFKPMKMKRRPLGDEDVLIDMVYCGRSGEYLENLLEPSGILTSTSDNAIASCCFFH